MKYQLSLIFMQKNWLHVLSKSTKLAPQNVHHAFDSVSAWATLYVYLGSSQQCEHANAEVTLRVPKSHHYGNCEALDFKVHATAVFTNDGRGYISRVLFVHVDVVGFLYYLLLHIILYIYILVSILVLSFICIDLKFVFVITHCWLQ